MSKLTHFNQAGEAHMVDIADKASTTRRAIAAGRITMQAETLDLIRQGKHKKGDVLGVARIAGNRATASCTNVGRTIRQFGSTGALIPVRALSSCSTRIDVD